MFETIIGNLNLVGSTMEHYNCMIDLLSRAGQLEYAIASIEEMPFAPNLVVWHTMIGACGKWGNVKLGRWAFEQSLQLDDNCDAAYVCMANIYAASGMQREAHPVEILMV